MRGNLFMADQSDILNQLSAALAARTATARNTVAAIQLRHDRHLTGTLWRPDALVASEQSLPHADEFEVIAPGGATVNAKIVGRDPGTNVAVLRLAQPVSPPSLVPGDAQPGALAVAFGTDGAGGATARLGIVNFAGPEWHSNAGGRIDQRIVLDLRVARAEEGGPVFDAAGACLGITTFGPRGQVIVIPSVTVERVVPMLLKDGYVARGWFGVVLQPVAVPDALQDAAGQPSGLMVMSLVEGGPAAKAGIVAGDILLTINGKPTRRFRRVATQLGPESIGRKVDVRVIRGGAVISLEATVEARPAAA
jgi:S1-C subfamily serine protease